MPPGSADVLVGTANGVPMGKRATPLFIGHSFAAKEDLGVPGAAPTFYLGHLLTMGQDHLWGQSPHSLGSVPALKQNLWGQSPH